MVTPIKTISIVLLAGIFYSPVKAQDTISCIPFPSKEWKSDILGKKELRKKILSCFNVKRGNLLPDILVGLDTAGVQNLLGKPDLADVDARNEVGYIYYIECIKPYGGTDCIPGSFVSISFGNDQKVDRCVVAWVGG
jgi:hypothetical protein